jgi:hypothetical protein
MVLAGWAMVEERGRRRTRDEGEEAMERREGKYHNGVSGVFNVNSA